MKVYDSNDVIAIRAGQRGIWKKFLFDYPPTLNYSLFACFLGTIGCGYQANVMNITWRVHDRWLDEWYWTVVDQENTPTTLWYLKQWILGSLYSTFMVGAIIGSYFASRFAHSEGIKKAISSSAIPATIAYCFICITSLTNYITFLYLGRFLIGIYCGFQSVLIPCYILEITHREIRGQCFAMCQIGYCLGVLFAGILGHQSLLGRQDNLDLYMSISVVAYAGQWWIMSSSASYGPRDLYIGRGKFVEAREALGKLISAQEQIDEYMKEFEEEKKYAWESRRQVGVASNFKEVLTSPGLYKQLRQSIWLQVIFQLCTINLFIASCSKVLENRDFDLEMATSTTIVSGAGLFITSICWARQVELYARRKTLLAGIIGMVVMQIYLFFILELVHEQTMRELFYGFGLFLLSMAYVVGPLFLIPLYNAELFTQEARWASISLSVTIQWILNLIMTVYIPLADYYMKSYILFPGVIVSVLSLVYIYDNMKETKGMDLVTISELFRVVKYRAYELQPFTIRKNEYINDELSTDQSDTGTID